MHARSYPCEQCQNALEMQSFVMHTQLYLLYGTARNSASVVETCFCNGCGTELAFQHVSQLWVLGPCSRSGDFLAALKLSQQNAVWETDLHLLGLRSR